MVAYADSSFLVSLYAQDAHTAKAQAWFKKHPYPLILTPFSKAEAQHALRMTCFRRLITEAELSQCLLTFEQDQAEGLFEPMSLDTTALFQKTSQLSHRYALNHGVCYLDTIHVASALLTKSTHFLTFDDRQAKLAEVVGLSTQ